MHCGVAESPQWRRGPSSKPVLCNACGTRYRRTSQLGAYRPALGPARSGQARKRCTEQGTHIAQGVKSARQTYVM
ncbi:hypothetical protein WJX81_000778 [Elliptochloris bilobata]|uniref:GATA-type domain-containing protein n=1 Tax=Elliptochloris bilobata TaxID=381761 RepID=A0AAW1RXE3_9CHLO